MTMPELNIPDPEDLLWFDDRVEAFIDGDLQSEDAERFHALLASHAMLSAEVEMARSITDAFSSQSDASCPDAVTRNVMAHVRKDWIQSIPARLKDGWRKMAGAGLRPALAMALLLIVVVSSTMIKRPAIQQEADVVQALSDVKMALAYLSDAGRTTASTVRQDVIGPLVVAPMSRGMNTAIEN